MYQVIIVGHVLVGLAVIGLILIQHGKGADAGAAFGSGSSGTVFGAQGSASFLSRTTAILAAVFFTTSLSLAILSGNSGDNADIMDIPVAEQAQMEIPAIEGEQAVIKVPALVEEELPPVEDESVVIEEDVTIDEGDKETDVIEENVYEEEVITP